MAAAYEEEGSKSAVGPAAAGATMSGTAFRQAEKRYQLHFEQQLRRRLAFVLLHRSCLLSCLPATPALPHCPAHGALLLPCRKGRLVGGKLTAQSTDLSDVIDIRSAKGSADIAVCSLQQPAFACSCQPSQASADDPNSSSSSITALVFRRHPGLVVFPAAVPALLQLQLMQAALQEWPDPPARTNHSKAYGMTLCQLFQAAQQELLLHTSAQLQPHRQQQQQQQDDSQPKQQQQQSGIQQQRDGSQQEQQSIQAPVQDLTPDTVAHLQQQQDRNQQVSLVCSTPQQHQQQQQQEGQAYQQQCFTAQLHQQQECCNFCRALQHPHQTDCNSSRITTTSSSSGASPWSPSGTGPKASVLLRKLRWVCLGPPYNWTDRVYEPHLPHRRLPPRLVHIAQQYAELAQTAQRQVTAAAAAGGGGAHSNGSGAVLPPQQQHTAAATSSSAAAGCDCKGSRPYVPDAALVNYYHGGDTLNGHKDDVERDLSQPIVTLSLGCDAVFLVGGLTR
jgi:alkylated DNA repair protein alkB family protein 1